MFNKIQKFARAGLFLATFGSQLVAGGPIIPDDSPGRGGMVLNDAEFVEPVVASTLVELFVGCFSSNLRSTVNPVTANSELLANLPINLGSFKVKFQTNLFFGTATAPFQLVGAPAGSTSTLVTVGTVGARGTASGTYWDTAYYGGATGFNATTNAVYIMRMEINYPNPTQAAALAETSGNKFNIYQCIHGFSNPGVNNTCNAPAVTATTATQYMAYDGLAYTQGNQSTSVLEENGKTYLKLKIDVQPELHYLTQKADGGGCVGWRSPLYLFFDEKRPAFSGVSEFPIDPWGRPTKWVEPNAPGFLLVLDRNNDGRITESSELFGDKEESNGFVELKKYDANADGVIDEKDPIFSKLQLWNDRDGDGVSRRHELFSLKSKKVVSINLGYKADNLTQLPTGVQFREYSKFKFVDSRGAIKSADIIDVWLGPSDARYYPQTVGLDRVDEMMPFGTRFFNLIDRNPTSLSTPKTGL